MPTLTETLTGAIEAIGAHNVLNVIQYTGQRALQEARWQQPGRPNRGLALLRALIRGSEPAWPARWEEPGPVRLITPGERGVTLVCDRGSVEVALFAADLARVRYLPHAHPAPPPLSYAIARPLEAWPAPAFEMLQTEGALLLCTGALTIGVALDTGQVFFADAQGRLLRTDVDAGWHPGDASPDGALRHRAALREDEVIFGLGERTTPWNRRGRVHPLWNSDPAGYDVGDDPLYINIPAYVGLHDAGSYLVFYENPAYAEFDLGATTPDLADHRFAGGELRYYFAAGPVPRLIERYTELTGRHSLPPLWMLGYHQSRWSYFPEDRVHQLAADLRAHRIPCDAIHLDIHYMDDYRVFTWDRKRFPHLPQLARDLREQGLKLIAIIDPGVKRDPRYRVYREGVAGRHFCTLPDGKLAHAPVWPGFSAFPDFTAAETRAWWGEQYRALVAAGIAGFWNDMNEPAVFSASGAGTLPGAVRHSLEGRGGDHREAHNLYGMLMARASVEGLHALQPEQRPVLITRAGWAGVQRHAVSWTGDNQSTWASLRVTVPMVLGLGLSGVGFTGPDVGGFVGAADGELFTRWIQQAAFMPFFRAHTAIGTPDQEPWAYGEPYLSIVRRFIELRYELLPYLYTAVWQMAERGWPMVRPLWWNDQEARDLWAIDDAFLCGDALLVAPVGEPGADKRAVTLPGGEWYDFWSNRLHAGHTTFEQYAPLETLPLFARAGSVLTLGESGASVEQRKDRFLRLSVYPLTAPGETVTELYEDAGEGLAYQQGDYRVSRFVQERTDERLILRWEKEGSYTPPYVHIELTLNGLARIPREIRADGEAFPLLHADPVRRTALIALPLFEVVEVVW